MHHDVFYQFPCWNGEVDAGVTANFLGAFTRESYFENMVPHGEKRYVVTAYPEFEEEYFEWVDLLEAVTTAHGRFTMIELGAGWGRWLVNGALAASRSSGVPIELIGVEAEPTHFKWMNTHFRDNGIDPSLHRLVQAAVADKDGNAWFLWGNSSSCYGQRLVPATRLVPRKVCELLGRRREKPALRARKVEAVSLNTLLQPLTKVDLIDLDVQGSEFLVLNAAAREVDEKVKRVHIATHGHKPEEGLRNLFSRLGWILANDYPSDSHCPTRWGSVAFQDGVQSWVNPRLLE